MIFRKFLVGVFVFFAILFGSAFSQEPVSQPAGLVGALEFTDIGRTPKGDGAMGQKAYVGFYYNVAPKFTAIAVGEYSENDLSSLENMVVRNAKFTATYDVFSTSYPFKVTGFLLGAVGNSWVSYSDNSVSTLMTSTGFGFVFPVKTCYWGVHFRLDSSKEYRQFCIGIDYALPFYINTANKGK